MSIRNGAIIAGTMLAIGTASAPAAVPSADESVPLQPQRLAHTLLVTTRALDAAVDRWLDQQPAGGRVPREAELLALYQQRIYRLLRRDDVLAQRTLRLLPSGLAREARDIVHAGRGLRAITPPLAAPKLRTGPPLLPTVLLRLYREAEARFGVSWEVLAAINFVESAFGKVRSDSAAGAQGPMQFLPATWAAYGLGGNVQDPHDAIMAAANFLRASGAPRDITRALWRYNPSPAYVDAVLRYARQIGGDRRHFYIFYSWQVFVRTTQGDLRLTGPNR
jgi:soluble lytic murein transglycosylase-like protein